jgi:hypothetical protein
MPPTEPLVRGIDTVDTLVGNIRKIQTCGIVAVLKYCQSTAQHPNKAFTGPELAALAKAGIKTGYLWETVDDVSMFSMSNLNQHANVILHRLETDKRAPGTIVFVAADFDMNAGIYSAKVKPYIASLQKKIKAAGFLLGAYGCGMFCQRARVEGLAHATILANAPRWNGSTNYGAADIKQLPGPGPLGLDADWLEMKPEALKLFPDPMG